MSAADTWGVATWGAGVWHDRTWPPGASWRRDWRWWYQYGGSTQPAWDITALVVEARWTTDSFTTGDGTFRGNLQPGTLNLRLYDRALLTDGLSRLGQIWATFNPTGATWCWFIRSVATRLGPPGDPSRFDRVITADTWPARLSASAYSAARPAESVAARLGAIVNRLNTDAGLNLPSIGGVIAADAHTVPAVVANADGTYPSWLAQVRQAATNGVAWWEASEPSDGAPGLLTLHYATWDTARTRTLASDQVLAWTVWQQTLETLVTKVVFNATNPAGVASTYQRLGGGWGAYGVQPFTMGLWGDVTATSGAQYAAVDATAGQLLTDRGSPDRGYVDTVSMQSGDRSPATAGGTAALWDPTAMTWAPDEVATWARLSGQPVEKYRVAQSSHRLDARTWEVVHTLDRFTQATALP